MLLLYDRIKHALKFGLISPIDGINPDDLNISKLINRTKELTEAEVIIALRPTIEGDTTTLYLKKILDKEKILQN